MENIDDNNRRAAFFGLILLIWIFCHVMSLSFYYHKVQAYNNGYQYISTYPKYTAFSINRYNIEYIPDYPITGDNILIFVNIDYGGEIYPCNDCVLNGYFTNEHGGKNTLFKNSIGGDEGVQFIYPGKQVEIVMEHKNSIYKFFVPLPSKIQSLNLALRDSIIAKIILPLYTLTTIVILGVLWLKRQIFRQNALRLLEDLKIKIIRAKKKK